MRKWDRLYATEAKNLLVDLGWSKARLAREMGLREATVYGWSDIWPLYALKFVEMAKAMEELKHANSVVQERLEILTNTLRSSFKDHEEFRR